MKRRKFLTYSIGTLAGVAGPGRSFAAKPCPPSIDGASSATPCPTPMNVIQAAADALAVGDWTNLAPNPQNAVQDIQWMTSVIYFDPIRNQIQYMGKSASGQSHNHHFHHYIYDADSATWSEPHQPAYTGVAQSTGHIWCHAFDPIEGNYYFEEFKRATIKKFSPLTQTWSELPACTNVEGSGKSLDDGTSGAPIFGWHPNLFGPGLPGLFALNKSGNAFAFDPRDDSWSLCQTTTPPDPYQGRNNGQAIYVPEIDSLAIFGQSNENTDYTLWLAAGGGSATNVVSESYLTSGTNRPPFIIAGKGAGARQGKVVNHPENPNRLLLFEQDADTAPAGVYDSDDYGDTWTLRTSGSHPGHYQHPFSTGDSPFTIGSLPLQKCVIGINSETGGVGKITIWKPGL